MKRPTNWALFCLLQAAASVPLVALLSYLGCGWGVVLYAVGGFLFLALGLATWNWSPPWWVSLLVAGLFARRVP